MIAPASRAESSLGRSCARSDTARARSTACCSVAALSRRNTMVSTGLRVARTSARDRGVDRGAGDPLAAELSIVRPRSGICRLPTTDWIHITRFDRRRLDWPPGVRVHRVALDPSRGHPARRPTGHHADRDAARLPGLAADLAMHAHWPIARKQQGWLGARDIERRLENQPGRWGNRRLRLLLADARRRRPLRGRAAACTGCCADAGITGWLANLAVVVDGSGYVIDVAFAGAPNRDRGRRLRDALAARDVPTRSDQAERPDCAPAGPCCGSPGPTWSTVRTDVVAAITSLLAA